MPKSLSFELSFLPRYVVTKLIFKIVPPRCTQGQTMWSADDDVDSQGWAAGGMHSRTIGTGQLCALIEHLASCTRPPNNIRLNFEIRCDVMIGILF